MTEAQPEVYVVICREMHGAIGLFPDLGVAINYARDATRQAADQGASCLYLPVPLRFLDGQVEVTRLEPDTKMPGQYL